MLFSKEEYSAGKDNFKIFLVFINAACTIYNIINSSPLFYECEAEDMQFDKCCLFHTMFLENEQTQMFFLPFFVDSYILLHLQTSKGLNILAWPRQDKHLFLWFSARTSLRYKSNFSQTTPFGILFYCANYNSKLKSLNLNRIQLNLQINGFTTSIK